MHSLAYIAIVGGAFTLAGFVKGVIGLGLPTVSIGLLSLVMAPVEAVALLFVPSLVTNIWRLAIGPNFRPLLARQWTMLVSICVGIAIGAYLFGTVRYPGAKRWLGVSLLAYAALGLSPVRFHVRQRDEPVLSPIIGAVTGLLASITGVFMVPNVPYLQALGLDRDERMQALGGGRRKSDEHRPPRRGRDAMHRRLAHDVGTKRVGDDQAGVGRQDLQRHLRRHRKEKLIAMEAVVLPFAVGAEVGERR